MSRIGRMPVAVPPGVEVGVKGSTLTAKGKIGTLELALPAGIAASIENGRVQLTRADDSHVQKSCHGLARTLVRNVLDGVSKGYGKELTIDGVGFKASIAGQKLMLSLGFSSPVEYMVPDGVKVQVDGGTTIKISGADKQAVGDVAARVRSYYPAEPYKGKGIQYKGEHIRRKVGKTVA